MFYMVILLFRRIYTPVHVYKLSTYFRVNNPIGFWRHETHFLTRHKLSFSVDLSIQVRKVGPHNPTNFYRPRPKHRLDWRASIVVYQFAARNYRLTQNLMAHQNRF